MATGGREDERNAINILWRIENLSYFHKEFHGDAIYSPIFSPHTSRDYWTSLHLFPRGATVNDENVRLVLLFTEALFHALTVDCEFSFLTCDGSPLVTRKGIRDTGSKLKFHFNMTDCLTQEELFVTKKSTFLPYDTLTVRCRVWKSEGNFPHNEFFSVRSRIEFAEKSIFWPIGAINLNQRETFPCSFEFIHGNVKFNMNCSLTGNPLQTPKLNIEVNADILPRDYVAKLNVSVWGNGQEVMKLEEKENSFYKSENQQTWVVPKFVLGENLKEKISLLQCGENISLLFHLTAVCRDISICREKENIVTSRMEQVSARTTSTFSEASCQTSQQSGDTPQDLQQINDCLGILGEDLFSLYQKQAFSDFDLRAGEVRFPVHKSILCARSPVFCSMFSNSMDESNSNSLDIPDLDAHALGRMLTFLYGGTVEPDLTLQSAANLYYAADKYQVDTLKQRCSSILQSQICVSNVSDILTLADRHRDSNLTSFVHNFLLSHFEDVIESTEWEKFMEINPALAGKSMLSMCKERKRLQKNSR